MVSAAALALAAFNMQQHLFSPKIKLTHIYKVRCHIIYTLTYIYTHIHIYVHTLVTVCVLYLHNYQLSSCLLFSVAFTFYYLGCAFSTCPFWLFIAHFFTFATLCKCSFASFTYFAKAFAHLIALLYLALGG